jgi:hypothetical protein
MIASPYPILNCKKTPIPPISVGSRAPPVVGKLLLFAKGDGILLRPSLPGLSGERKRLSAATPLQIGKRLSPVAAAAWCNYP